MSTINVSKRRFLQSGIAVGGLALTSGRTLAQGAPVTLRMSSTLPNDPVNSAHAVWYNRFAANLKTAVGDKLVVNYFPSDQLGKESDMVQQVRLGSVDMMISGTSIWATLMPEMGVLDMGYLFASNDHCGRALDGKAGAILGNMLQERTNVMPLGWGYSLGARNVWTKNPIPAAADLKGVKLRVLPVPNFIATLKYMGAVPTPLPFGEIYTALQTGVIDAFESPADFILSSKNYEVAGYITRTHHIFTEVSMMASARKMASLPVNVQKVIRESAFEAVQKEMWETNLKAQESAWNDLAKRIKANPNPDIASFRSKMAPVINGFIGKAGAKGKAFVEAVQAAGKA